MPSKDSSGKRISGAQQRKIRAAKLAPYQKDAGRVPDTPSPEYPKPPEDVGQLIAWAAMMLGKLLADAYNDKNLLGADRYRTIGQLTAQLGMIRDKALDQERITRMAKKTGLIADEKQSELKPTHGLTRPQTARRLRKPGDDAIC